MSEEVNKVDDNKPDEGSTPEPTPIEVRARELGWRPREEFHGDEEDFVDAKEFVQRQPLFEKIESQSKQLKNVQKTLEALKQHYGKVQETEYKRALAQLEAQRAEAISDADGNKAIQVERQIKNVEREFEQIKREQETNQSAPDPQEFISWKSKNTWYETDETMRMVADTYGTKLAKEGMAPADVLREVTKKVRTEFAHKFRNPNKDNAPDVSNSSPRGNSTPKEDNFQLTDEERRMMNTFVRDGVMTKEQYIKDLKAIKARG